MCSGMVILVIRYHLITYETIYEITTRFSLTNGMVKPWSNLTKIMVTGREGGSFRPCAAWFHEIYRTDSFEPIWINEAHISAERAFLLCMDMFIGMIPDRARSRTGLFLRRYDYRYLGWYEVEAESFDGECRKLR